MPVGSFVVACALAATAVEQVQFQIVAPAAAVPASPAEAPSSTPAAAASSAKLAAELAVDVRTTKLDARFVVAGQENGSTVPSSDGLKLALQGGAAERKEYSLSLPVRLRGDFEVTFKYDQLGIGDEPPGRGAGVAFGIAAPGPGAGEVVRVRVHRLWNEAQQRNWVTERIVERTGGMQTTESSIPAGLGKEIRVRLARTGGTLRTLVEEQPGAGFREVGTVDFPTTEAAGIQVLLHNGNQRASVKVRLLEFAIRAEKLGGKGPTVTNIHGQTFAGLPTSIDAGTLVVGGDSPQKIALDELLLIDLDREAAAGSPAAAAAGDSAILHFDSGDRLVGTLAELNSESARFKTSWGAEVDVPLARLAGIEFLESSQPAAAAPPGAPGASPATASATGESTAQTESPSDRWRRELASPGESDQVLVRARDAALTTVAGSVQALREGKLAMLYEGQSRNIDRTRVVGIVFAAHPAPAAARTPFQRFHFVDGQRLSGTWVAIAGDRFELLTAWDARWEIPAGSLREITAHNGRMVYLSDLEPASVEQVPYFGRVRELRRDQSLSGGPLRVGDSTFAKGLAVHSKTVLSYAIDGAFAQFRATLGFDPAAGRQGRVACRVLGDGRELFADADLRADEPAAVLDLPVAGVGTLVLEVDFGEFEDAGDDVIWGNPQLFREPPQPAAP